MGTRTVVFTKALSGTSFATEDGREVRLAGVMAPADSGEAASPGAVDAARNALSDALRAGAVTIAATDTPDRYGRIVAQVFVGGDWVQGKLLKSGTVRMSPDRASALCARQLAEAEDEARMAQTEHWRDGAFTLRTPDQLKGRVGTFQMVEGEVTTASTNKGRGYINFGADYRTDFTVTVEPDDMKLFRQARFDVKKLAGKHVRVRGWIEQYNGPEMVVSTPTAIQILDDPAPKVAETTKAADVTKTAETKAVDAEKPSKKEFKTAKKKRTRKKKTET